MSPLPHGQNSRAASLARTYHTREPGEQYYTWKLIHMNHVYASAYDSLTTLSLTNTTYLFKRTINSKKQTSMPSPALL